MLMPGDRVAALSAKRFKENIGEEGAAFLLSSTSKLLGLRLGEELADFTEEEMRVLSDLLVSGNEDIFEVHWGLGEQHAFSLLADLQWLWRIFIPDYEELAYQRDFNAIAIRQVESGVANMACAILEGMPLSEVLVEKYKGAYIEKAMLVAGLADTLDEGEPDIS